MKYGYSWSCVCSPCVDDSEVFFASVDFEVTVDFSLYLDCEPDLANGEKMLRLQCLLLGEARQHVKDVGAGLPWMDNDLWRLEHDPLRFSRVPPSVDLGYSFPDYVFSMRCVFKNSIDLQKRNVGAMSGVSMFSFLYALGNTFAACIVANRPFLAAVGSLISLTWSGSALVLPELYICPSARRAGKSL